MPATNINHREVKEKSQKISEKDKSWNLITSDWINETFVSHTDQTAHQPSTVSKPKTSKIKIEEFLRTFYSFFSLIFFLLRQQPFLMGLYSLYKISEEKSPKITV